MPKFPITKGLRSTVNTIRKRKDVPHKLRVQKIKLGSELAEVEEINPENTNKPKKKETKCQSESENQENMP